MRGEWRWCWAWLCEMEGWCTVLEEQRRCTCKESGLLFWITRLPRGISARLSDAYEHFEESGHTFSMDLDSKRVWDYVGDSYVHRIIQDAAKPGEKLVELPGRRSGPTALEGQEDVDMLKMENVALEYTHLLTSQLESQRVYFEEVVERAVDKLVRLHIPFASETLPDS